MDIREFGYGIEEDEFLFDALKGVESYTRTNIGDSIIILHEPIEPKEDGKGFKLSVFEIVGHGDDGTTVNELMRVFAYFDGIRHMYTNYQNYPDLSTNIKILEAIKKIEVECCWDVD